MDAGPALGQPNGMAPTGEPPAGTMSLSPAAPGTTSGNAGTERVEGAAEDVPAVAGSHPHKALVLNATMEPLCVVPARRAVVLVLNAKADVISANGHRFRSERIDIAAPSIIRLRSYVRVPYRRRAALSRRGVFIRDDHTCQYCGVPAENVDHVLPRSRGGAHVWENVVAACRRCNGRKKDRTPAEARMTLSRPPFAPRAAFWLVVAVGGLEPTWDAYLGDALRLR